MSFMTSRLTALGAGCLLAGGLAGSVIADDEAVQAEELPSPEVLEAEALDAGEMEEEAEGELLAEAEPEAADEPPGSEDEALEEALLEAVEEEADEDAPAEDEGTDAEEAAAEDPADAESAEAEEGVDGEASADGIPDSGGIEGFERSPSERDSQQRSQMLFEQAQSHLQVGEVGDAAQTLRRAVNLNPEHHQARYTYARIMVATGRPGHAREIVRAGLERAPHHMPMARLYAALAAEAGDLGSAAAALEQAGEPRDGLPVEVRGQLAALYRRGGQYEKAIEHYRTLAEAEPQEGRWEAGRAIALEGQGDVAGALEAWRRTLEASQLSEELERYARARILGLQQQAD